MPYAPFYLLAIVLVWRLTKLPGYLRQRSRSKQIRTFIQTSGYQALKTAPATFPLNSFPMVQSSVKGLRTFTNGGATVRGGREVLFFDYTLSANPGIGRTLLFGQMNREVPVAQTVVAARGGAECFPAAKIDPTLRLETVGGWTIAFHDKQFLAETEIGSLVSAVPAAA